MHSAVTSLLATVPSSQFSVFIANTDCPHMSPADASAFSQPVCPAQWSAVTKSASRGVVALSEGAVRQAVLVAASSGSPDGTVGARLSIRSL